MQKIQILASLAGIGKTGWQVHSWKSANLISLYVTLIGKIAGRKRPALVYPSHKVRQGGKGKYGYPTCWVVVYFHLAECVLLRPGSISGRQSVFRHVLVNFRSAECVPPCPGLISSWQSTSGPLESVLIKNIKLRAHYILFPKICGRTYEHTNIRTYERTYGKKMWLLSIPFA